MQLGGQSGESSRCVLYSSHLHLPQGRGQLFRQLGHLAGLVGGSDIVNGRPYGSKARRRKTPRNKKSPLVLDISPS